jgi:hypothetical protein
VVVILPRVDARDFPPPGLAGSTFRHLSWREVTRVAFSISRQANFDNKIWRGSFLTIILSRGPYFVKKILKGEEEKPEEQTVN